MGEKYLNSEGHEKALFMPERIDLHTLTDSDGEAVAELMKKPNETGQFLGINGEDGFVAPTPSSHQRLSSRPFGEQNS